MDRETRLKRLKFRAWHRGTKEADLLIGGYYDHYAAGWSEEEIAWFESLLDLDDVHIMAWAMQTEPVPDRFAGDMMERMQRLDFVPVSK
ncbi:succinate dehydrogenase assembly factor 2 [uncultured Parasphingopyxis sp.]|uniref:FAD assembly factor SdhE n=1 Tax=uncultured Parasphingopyxis sp. TaxID=1547918 RepID=UPI002625D133|nr:succinate dehydrogenase assembly factor 2 [uncultured Parasphingopyxis sp.]